MLKPRLSSSRKSLTPTAAKTRRRRWARTAAAALLGAVMATALVAQDPQLRHELDELTLRQGAKPWIRMIDGEVFPSERTIFRDTVTGAEIWRLTDAEREDMHDYYDKSVWNSIGSHLILHRENEVTDSKVWVMPANGAWVRPVASVTRETMEFDLKPEPWARGFGNYWSWEDPTKLINLYLGIISVVDPVTVEITEIFDLTTSPLIDDPQLPVLEPKDFSINPPHPLDDRLLIDTQPKGRLFSFDMAAKELLEVPTDGRWTAPPSQPDAWTIHRVRWTKSPEEPIFYLGQDAYVDEGEIVTDLRQFTLTLDGTMTDWNLPAFPDKRGGHPDWSMDGRVLTATYPGGIRWLDTQGSPPARVIYDVHVLQHHSSFTWDDRWLATDNGEYGGPGTILRGYEVEHGIVVLSEDGRAQNVLNYHYSSYASDEATHPGPTSSPDGTKIVYDSDMLDRGTDGGGDGDGNPDLWMVVVRPPSRPESVIARAQPDWVQLTWQRPSQALEEIYWNPGNPAREIVGYNVLRGLASGGPYEQLNDELIEETLYRDTTFEAGVSYYYVVQAVEHSGLASLYSREVFASSASRRWLGDLVHYYEAEDGELTLPMVPQFDAIGSNGSWFVGTFAQEPDPAFPIEAGPAAVSLSVGIPAGGRYSLWARVLGYDGGGSFDVEVDGEMQDASFDVPPGDWTWVELPITVRLRPGEHRVGLITEDAGVGVDQIALMLGATGPPPDTANRDTLPPAPPSDLRVVAIEGNTKKLEWSPSPDAEVAYYNVYCGRDSSYSLGNRNLLRSPPDTMTFDWGIPGGLATVYKVTAVDRFGNESEAIVFDPSTQSEESAPIAQDDLYETTEDEVLEVPALGILANDHDEDGDVLAPEVLVGTENGVLELQEDGGFTYTPDFEFSGEDSFAYYATDGISTSELAIVTITVGNVADVPVANDDFYELDEDSALDIPKPGVKENDFDDDTDILTTILVQDAQHGTLNLRPNGSFQYIPDKDFFGTEIFTYKLFDGTTESNVATVKLTVHPTQDAPTSTAEEYVAVEDLLLDVPAPGVLANDDDVDGDTLMAVLVVDAVSGTLNLNQSGALQYLSNPNFCGVDSFTYVASDGIDQSVARVVKIDVSCVNDVPQALNDAYQTDEGVALDIPKPGVKENDIEVDGDIVTTVLVQDASHGTLNLRPNGSFVYSPDKDFAGSDSFTYKLNDGTSESNVATVSLTIRAF